jgi:N-acetyl-anhydromuramoyl-L-alanine amidase
LAHTRTGVEVHALIRARRRGRDVPEGCASWRLDPESGWLEGVRRVPSPNCDERPPETDIDLVVVHGISLPPRVYGGEYIDRLFTNTLDPDAHADFRPVAGLRVSAHVLIRRDGGLTQYVPLHLRAWHAGASRFEDRTGCNDFSIGIELEGWDRDPYEHVQYQILAELIGTLSVHWPGIRPERVVGHSDIASGRKTDPGPAFEWRRLRTLLSIYMS